MTATVRTRTLYGVARAERLSADMARMPEPEPYDEPLGPLVTASIWLGLIVGGWGLLAVLLLALGKAIALAAWAAVNLSN